MAVSIPNSDDYAVAENNLTNIMAKFGDENEEFKTICAFLEKGGHKVDISLDKRWAPADVC